jgi:integrase
VLEATEGPRIKFHVLRHTAASLMLNNGIPVIVVSRMLGHTEPSITLNVYGHMFAEMQGDAAELMDELVIPIPVDVDEWAFPAPEHGAK